MKKKVLIFLMVICMLSGMILLPPYIQEASAAGVNATSAITYDIKVVSDTTFNNDIKYTLSNVSLDSVSNGYSSVTIAIPEGYVANYTLPTGWKDNISGNIISFIISTPATNGTSAVITNFLSNTFSLSLATENAVPTEPVSLTINVSENLLVSRVDENGVTHYYEFVPANSMNWAAAYNSAKARTLNGLQGYLTTITSQEEQDFIYNSIAKTGGWLGATRMRNNSDKTRINNQSSISTNINDYDRNVSVANDWYWADGPEGGTVFFNGATSSGGSQVDGQYSYWNPGQPDNSNGEFVLQFAFGGTKWNDLPFTQSTYAKGFYVEYGGYPGETPIQDNLGYQVPIPAPVKIEFLNVSNEALFNDEFIFGDLGNSFTAVNPYAAPTGYAYLGIDENSDSLTGTFSKDLKTIIYRYGKIYNVDFDLNYSTSEAAPKSQEVAETTLVDNVSEPAREGHTFIGWNVSSEGDDNTWDFANTKMPANDVTLYAQWEVNNYNLNYKLNGGEGVTPDTQSVNFGSLLIEPTIPQKLGYTFKGWNTEEKGTGSTWDFASGTMPANDVTLYAQWQINQYKLNFNLNGGDGITPMMQELDFGNLAIEPSIPQRPGYTFKGWNIEKEGTGITWNFGSETMPANDVTLYAQWEVKEKPVPPAPKPEPKPTPTPAPSPIHKAGTVTKTGDDSNAILIVISLFVAGISLISLSKKKHSKKENN